MEDEEYEFEIDDEAFIKHCKEYKRVSAILLENINQREEYTRLLKIVKPEKISLLREGIKLTDNAIEAAENYLESVTELIRKRREYLESVEECWAMSEKILQGLRKKYADDPEKLELIEAFMEDNGESH